MPKFGIPAWFTDVRDAGTPIDGNPAYNTKCTVAEAYGLFWHFDPRNIFHDRCEFCMHYNYGYQLYNELDCETRKQDPRGWEQGVRFLEKGQLAHLSTS